MLTVTYFLLQQLCCRGCLWSSQFCSQVLPIPRICCFQSIRLCHKEPYHTFVTLDVRKKLFELVLHLDLQPATLYGSRCMPCCSPFAAKLQLMFFVPVQRI